MQLKMKKEYAHGKQNVYELDVRESKEVFPMEEGAKIKHLKLDPEEKLLDLDRTNDQWPRRLYIKPVPLFIGLQDMPIVLPEDSYNLVVGPELANNGLGLKASFQK